MTLVELAIGSYIYGAMTDDGGYSEFLTETNPALDLRLAQHRNSLLTFLNNWGCRQFAKAYHPHAARRIERWDRRFGNKFFSSTAGILTLTSADLDTVEESYKGLVNGIASKQIRSIKGKNTEVYPTFGPVGTAKLLFAFRPQALMPWDDAIRQHFGLDGSASSYRQYLLNVIKWLLDLRGECEKHGFTLNDLPVQLGRPKSSLPKLIDEYLWVTVTNKCKLPTKPMLEHWVRWF
jgi:hypothetical protein